MRRNTGLSWLRSAWLVVLERRRARAVCRDLLRLYRQTRTADANLQGEALYEQVVARYNHGDARGTKELLNHAEQSFAQWPSVRNLTFRDVVLYLVVSESTTADRPPADMRPDIAAVVYSAIPAEL